MAMKILSVCVSQLALLFLLLNLANGQGLKLGFYNKICPQAEQIIQKTIARYVLRAPTLAAPLLRMHFHDCFVRGCDASLLLNSTKGNTAEKDHPSNLSLRGFYIFDAVKEAVEKVCPGVVSCADIVALAARDAVSLIHGPTWDVPTGRRDGRVSKISDILTNSPSPFMNITQLKQMFSAKGLDSKDLAVLSGGHTIGNSHCTGFSYRIYSFTGKGDTDPALDSKYIPKLKAKCKPGDTTTLVEMDPGSFRTFDTHYYSLIQKRRGLFVSDSALLNDPVTNAYITTAVASPATFFKDFAASMVKMGKVGVLTGNAGEIRKVCYKIN
ncbi:hypothetical protein AMTRI_Chr02g216250 [Amborella trichopoda]